MALQFLMFRQMCHSDATPSPSPSMHGGDVWGEKARSWLVNRASKTRPRCPDLTPTLASCPVPGWA